jgi:hypothetical protein
MQAKAKNKDYIQLKKIHSGRWMQGLLAALVAFMYNYSIISVTVTAIAEKRKGKGWQDVLTYWFDVRFLQVRTCLASHFPFCLPPTMGIGSTGTHPLRLMQMIAGLMDLAEMVRIAEKDLQCKDISFVERDTIMKTLQKSLGEPVADGKHFRSFTRECITKEGAVHFREHKLRRGGVQG